MGRLKPSLEPSEDLAYIVGSLKRKGHYGKYGYTGVVILQTLNEKLASNFKERLRSINLNPNIEEIKIGSKKGFKVRAYSTDFYEWIENLDLEDIDKLLEDRDKKLSFLKGFYEVKGGCYKQQRRYIISLSKKGKKKLMTFIKNLLEELDFHPKFYSLNNKDYKEHMIKIQRKEDICRFIDEIDPVTENISTDDVIRHTHHYGKRKSKGKFQRVKKWNKEKVKDGLKDISQQLGHSPSTRELIKNNKSSLLGACMNYFKSFNEAKRKMGLGTYKQGTNQHMDNLAELKWKEWEDLVIKASKKLFNAEAKPVLPNGTLPDARIKLFGRSVVIDAKTYTYGSGIERDKENYLPYCDKLQFWCLKGKRKSRNKNVEFVSSNKILSLLDSFPDLKKQVQKLTKQKPKGDVLLSTQQF